jgi:protein-S-isoprenylcysteine O-methyltransferase Ste14
MIQVLAFLAGSLLLLAVSWQPLRHPAGIGPTGQPGGLKSHGYYRFFAWEAILLLIVINAPGWFVDPSSWHQVISWLLLLLSLVPLAFGVQALRTEGRPDMERRTDAGLIGFERTTRLVTDGIYRYIRHPLYSSLLLLGWGTFFKAPSQTGITLALIATLFLNATAKADEAECTQAFGPSYQEYMKRTKMFIPYVF